MPNGNSVGHITLNDPEAGKACVRPIGGGEARLPETARQRSAAIGFPEHDAAMTVHDISEFQDVAGFPLPMTVGETKAMEGVQ
jgi:hypothetical protein